MASFLLLLIANSLSGPQTTLKTCQLLAPPQWICPQQTRACCVSAQSLHVGRRRPSLRTALPGAQFSARLCLAAAQGHGAALPQLEPSGDFFLTDLIQLRTFPPKPQAFLQASAQKYQALFKENKFPHHLFLHAFWGRTFLSMENLSLCNSEEFNRPAENVEQC